MNESFALQRYLDDIAGIPALTGTQEERLGRRAAAGDLAAQSQLIRGNLRLVVTIARRYQGLGLDLLDLIQEGNLGLIDASKSFDPRHEMRFSAYAGWPIRHAIMRTLTRTARLMRLPRRLAEASSRVRRAEAALTARLGRVPRAGEVAAEAGLECAVVLELRRADLAPRSFEEPIDEGLTLADVLRDDRAEDPSMVPEDPPPLAALDDRARRIIELRFGLDGGPERSLREVAHELDLSQERVRRLEHRALAQMASAA